MSAIAKMFAGKYRVSQILMRLTGRCPLHLLVISILLASGTAAIAGRDDRYRYVLEHGKNTAVCLHMEKVYNKHFLAPWKRPAILLKPTSGDAESPYANLYAQGIIHDYGPQSPYAFSKSPGVLHDGMMTLEMSFSRLPTSSEFDAIPWREGRYRYPPGPTREHSPMLVAEFDIDNDGSDEVVVKAGFMLNFFPSETGRVAGGHDIMFVFEKGAIDLTKPITLDDFYEGQDGGKRPAYISQSARAPYRLIRPFVFEGATYLSGYNQIWNSDFDESKVREYMDVVRYVGGRINLGLERGYGRKWGPLRADLICRIRMEAEARQ